MMQIAEVTRQCLDRITVGVGGSERSFEALRCALWLARGAGSHVEVLVANEILPALDACLCPGEALQTLLRQAEIVANEHTNAIRAKVEAVARRMHVPVEITCTRGRSAGCLADAESRTSLFVVGKRGHGEEHGGLLGSNTELLLRRTHRPVLITPRQFLAPLRITVAYAGATSSSRNLMVAAALTHALRLPLTVLVIHSDAAERGRIVERARVTMQQLGVMAAFEAHDGRPAERIRAASSPDTLLVVGATGRSRLYHLVLGNVTEEVMRSAKGPIIIAAKKTLADATA